MQRTITLAIALTLVLVSASAVADLAPLPPVAADQPLVVKPEAGATQQAVSLAVGRHLLVQLSAQLGTGFDWAVGSEPTPLLTSLGSRVLRSQSGSPGGAQLQEFEFVAEKKGTATLTFIYRQPWRTDAAPAKTFALAVTIGPAE